MIFVYMILKTGKKRVSSLGPKGLRGRSEHHTVAHRVTPVRREARTSATERMYGSAVVKSGKLCVVQAQIGQRLRASGPKLAGRVLEGVGNGTPR